MVLQLNWFISLSFGREIKEGCSVNGDRIQLFHVMFSSVMNHIYNGCSSLSFVNTLYEVHTMAELPNGASLRMHPHWQALCDCRLFFCRYSFFFLFQAKFPRRWLILQWYAKYCALDQYVGYIYHISTESLLTLIYIYAARVLRVGWKLYALLHGTVLHKKTVLIQCTSPLRLADSWRIIF
jgi:hypothetical protein